MQIRLAPFPKGKESNPLTKAQRQYIDENHPYEPITTMANMLRIKFIDVHVYCTAKGYHPSKRVKAKPKKAAKCDTFDIDNYNPATI